MIKILVLRCTRQPINILMPSPRKSIESQAFPKDRTVSILTVETAAVNNLISFCEGQHFYIKDLRTSRVRIADTLDRVADTQITLVRA